MRRIGMKYILSSILFIASLFLLCGWASQQTNIDSKGKPALNFRGTIITQNDQQLKIENILIGGMYEKIQLYDTPIDTETPRTQLCLAQDPSKGIGTTIGLDSVYEISVPEPTVIWYYERHPEGERCNRKTKDFDKVEYIEIIITSNNLKKTQHRYLIDVRKEIKCNEINEGNEKKIPFSAIKNLIITEPPIAREAEKQISTKCIAAMQASSE